MSRHQVFFRPSSIYIAGCFLLALLAVNHNLALWILVALTFPLSLFAYLLTYFLGVILFGPGEWGLLGHAFFVVLWTGAAVVQALIGRDIWSAVQATRAQSHNA